MIVKGRGAGLLEEGREGGGVAINPLLRLRSGWKQQQQNMEKTGGKAPYVCVWVGASTLAAHR